MSRDDAGADPVVFGAEPALEQQRGRRQPDAFVAVVGADAGARPRWRAADPADDGAESTSASSGLTTRSRSVSVLDGAICSSGTSSPVVGSRYCTRLWWLSSRSSSTRTPVSRRTSMIAHAQKAWSSSRVRSRRLPVSGIVRPRRCPGRRAAERTRVSVCPAAVNVSPGGVWRAASSRARAAVRRSVDGRGPGRAARAAVRGCGRPSAPCGAARTLRRVEVVLADGAGRDPGAPPARVFQRPFGQVQVEGPDRGQACRGS